VAGLISSDKSNNSFSRAFDLAKNTTIEPLREWVYWFAATQDGSPLNLAFASLEALEGPAKLRRLSALWLALEPRGTVRMPESWKKQAAGFYQAEDRTQRLAEKIGATFGDKTPFPKLRTILADTGKSKEQRQHAFDVLSRANDRESLAVFLRLLDESNFREAVLRQVAQFDSTEVSSALINRFASFSSTEKSAALNALAGRPASAVALLDAVAAGKIPRDQITAFQIGQLQRLKSREVDQRLTSWGKLKQTPVEKKGQIDSLEKTFSEAPLWAYSASAGREHFNKLCASCHRIGNEGTMLGPDLTGAGKHGVRYFLENIIDPDAVIGTDFQLTTIATKGEEVLAGLLVNETSSAVTLRTTAGEKVIPKAQIESRELSEKSLMPEGLLETMGDREKIELLKFLTSN
jgi:putative heme-binding domain-containing protein